MNLNEISSELAKRVSKARKLQALQSTVKGLSSLKGDEVAKHSQDADKYMDKSRRAALYANKPVNIRESDNFETKNRINELEQNVKDAIRVLRHEISQTDEELSESAAWQKKSGKNKNGGLNKKGVASYRREHPGSKLQTAVTTKPSKLKKGSKASKRRKSFCKRMKGMKKKRTSAKTARDPNSRINKSLRKWNC